MHILTLNIGSSSIKYKIFDAQTNCIHSDSINGIGTNLCDWPDIAGHTEAIPKLANKLANQGYTPKIICHRVVHGGNYFTDAQEINQEVIAKIAQISGLAPLHNPIQLEAIKQAITLFPKAKQIAFFDTAFHHTISDSQKIIPINKGPEIRNYGFHGLNYAYVNTQLQEMFNKPINAIICHLGNGASICAIKQGKSFATSMGMTPNNGLIMGTRSGNIDPGVITHLNLNYNMSIEEIDDMLNRESGLLAIAGSSDMRQCEQLAKNGNKKAILAIETFSERVRFYIGGYTALLGNIDCLAFTGGIGENSSLIRQLVLDKLDGYHLDEEKNTANHQGLLNQNNSKPIALVPANEEKFMAQSALKTLII